MRKLKNSRKAKFNDLPQATAGIKGRKGLNPEPNYSLIESSIFKNIDLNNRYSFITQGTIFKIL